MKKIIYTASVVALALMAVACDNNDSPAEWQPAPEANQPGIFFTNTDNILSVTAEDAELAVTLPVRRLVTEGALSVPLVVTTDNPSIIVPSTVDFSDGQADAIITIDLSRIPTKQAIPLNITFPEEYISPYAAGSAVFDGSVLVSDWEELPSGPIVINWYNLDYSANTQFDPVEQTMLYLPGTKRFRILNFLNSDIDFTFDLQASDYPTWTGYHRIMPMGNQVMYTEYNWTPYYNSWWFVSDDLQTWPELQLAHNGDPIVVYGGSFMWYDDDSQWEYSFMRLAGDVDVYGKKATYNSAYMAFFGFLDESWEWSNYTGWLRLGFDFPAIEE